MKAIHSNQRGIAHLALLLVLVVVVAVGVVGWRVMNSKPATPTSTVAAVPAKLTSKADVKTAATALDSTDVDSSLNPDQLDSDLNSLY